jgi:hypothetical protein
MGVWRRYRFDGHREECSVCGKLIISLCLRDLDASQMTFAPLCPSLPGFARCLREYYRLSMQLPAIKSEGPVRRRAVALQTGR